MTSPVPGTWYHDTFSAKVSKKGLAPFLTGSHSISVDDSPAADLNTISVCNEKRTETSLWNFVSDSPLKVAKLPYKV